MPKILVINRSTEPYGVYEIDLPAGKSTRSSFKGKSISGGEDVSFTAAEVRLAAEGVVNQMGSTPADSEYYKSFEQRFPDSKLSANGVLDLFKSIPGKLTVDNEEYARLKAAGGVADEPAAPPPPRKPREGSDKAPNVPAAAPPPPPNQAEGAAPRKPREGSDRPSVALRKSPRESTVTATAISKSKAGKEKAKQVMPETEKTQEGKETAAAPSAVPAAPAAQQPPGADPSPGPAGGARAFDNSDGWWDDAMESIMQHVESGDGEASPYYQVLMDHGNVKEKEAGVKRYDMLLKAVLAQRSRQQLQQTQTETHVADVHKGRDTLASGAHADATGDQHDRDMHASNQAIHAAEAERQRQNHAALRSRAGAGASASGEVLQPHEPGAQPRMQATGRSGKAPANAATAASNALSNASQQFQFRPSTGVGPTKRPRTHLQGPGQQPQQPEAPGSIVPGSGESAAHTAMTGLTATGMPAAPFHAGQGLQPSGMPSGSGAGGSGSGAGGGAGGGQPPQQPPVGFPFQQQGQAQQVAGQQQQQAAAPESKRVPLDVSSKDRPAGGEDSGYKGQTTSVDVEKGLKGTIHRVAVRRICTPKGINFAQWTASWLRTNGASLKAESDAELLQGSIDLCQQYIDTMRVKAPRFGVGAPRMKLLKERVELEVLAAISTPSEEDGLVDGSRLGLLLDASKLGMDLSDLEAALKGGGGGGGGGGGDGGGGGGAPNPHTAPLGPDGKPKKGHAVGSAHQIAENGKNAALAGAVRTFDRPDEYKHMRNPNDRIQREFVADRRLYNNDLTMQHPITPDTFTLKIKRNETQRRVLF